MPGPDQRPKTPPKSNKDTTDNPVSDHASPNKGTLKVTKYGLRKSHHKTRSYKCQNCGKRERSVRELNDHHRQAHPPLLCSDCNKIFYVPSTFQLHLYEHQKEKRSFVKLAGKNSASRANLISTGSFIEVSSLINAWPRTATGGLCVKWTSKCTRPPTIK